MSSDQTSSQPLAPKRVLLVTGHYLKSLRRAGFHCLSQALWQAGWDVTFFTAAISWASRLKGDHRFKYPIIQEANRVVHVEDRLSSFVWYKPFHPLTLRSPILEALTYPLFVQYGRLGLGAGQELVEKADLIIFESTPGLLLLERFKELNPPAKFIYRVSDDLQLLRNHKVVLDIERRVAPLFDLVSVPTQAMLAKFSHLTQARVHPHGIAGDVLDADYPNPYSTGWEANAVFVGASRLDYDVLARAAKLMPRYAFHIIGPFENLPQAPNIFAHGEMEFARTAAYIKHADIGLHMLEQTPGAECFVDSLKVLQYTYCQLPIVAPQFLRSSRSNMYYYQPGDDDSIRQALQQARACERSAISRDGIITWDQLAKTLAAEVGI